MEQIPDGARTVHTDFDTVYLRDHEPEAHDLRRLYENAKRDQWNVSTDIDWKQPVDLDEGFVADGLIDIHGTKFWDKMNKKEKGEMNRLFSAWRLSQLFHGEHGAVLVCGQLANVLPTADGKYFMATQVMDEARHVEVFAQYLDQKLDGIKYPCNTHLGLLLDDILEDSRWDMTYLGMQIMVEGLALAAFQTMRDYSTEPLIKELTAMVMKDESRHVAFGVLSLKDYYRELSEAEVDERVEFVYEGCRLMRDRLLQREVYEKMGLG